jgi:adenylate cyclase
MVTGETRRAAESAGDDCIFRFLDKIIVKGRSEPAEMHEIVCLRSDIDQETTDCLDLYNEGLAHHLARRWAPAIEAFEKSARLERNRPDLNPDSTTTPSAVLLARSIHYQAHPPGDDWTGVHRMQSK